MPIMEKLRMLVAQEPVVAASCLIGGFGLFLPAVVRPMLDSFEASKQVKAPPHTDYSLLLILLILVEIGCAAFIFFDNSWRDEIPSGRTGNFDTIYTFLRENWNIVRWVALGAVVFEALLFLLALIVPLCLFSHLQPQEMVIALSGL